jgi:hypothetical protein
MPSLRLKSAAEARHCGSCTVCCTHLPLFDRQRPAGSSPATLPCPHVGALGCRIYSQRPKPCVQFSCAWLRDPFWPGLWRPDRAGLLCLREVLEGEVPAAEIHEIWAGALQRPEAVDILNELVRTTATMSIIDAACQRQRILGRWSRDNSSPADDESVGRPIRAA